MHMPEEKAEEKKSSDERLTKTPFRHKRSATGLFSFFQLGNEMKKKSNDKAPTAVASSCNPRSASPVFPC